MNTLKPCPFCGGTKICTEKSINLNYCDNCSAESNVEHWNNRPIEDALNARIAELEKDNAEFRQLIRDWSIVLEQDDLFQLWHVESVRQAMLEINKESEE